MSLVVSPTGLVELVRTLHRETDRLSELTNGVKVRVFAQSRGHFVVYLTHDQAYTLNKYVPRANIESWFGDSDIDASN